MSSSTFSTPSSYISTLYEGLLSNGTLIQQDNQTMANSTTYKTSAAQTSTVISPSSMATNTTKDISPFDAVLITMYIPFLLIAAFGNLLVIVVRVKKFKLHGLSAYKQLICHLSLADVIYATAIPLDIYLKINKKDWIASDGACKILRTTQSASLTASVCILTVMAFERFQGISNPLAHHWSTKRVTLLAVLIWVYSYANFVPYATALEVVDGYCIDHEYPHQEFAKWYTLYQFLSTWLVPLLFIVFFHFGMVVKVITHRRTIKRSTYRTPALQNRNGSQPVKGKQRKRKMVKILVVIVTLFAILTLPVHVWYLWYEFSDRDATQNYSLEIIEIFAALVYMHSAVNPVIYSVMDRSFREDVRVLFNIKSVTHEAIRMRAINGATQESY